jgi:hypothetical protein
MLPWPSVEYRIYCPTTSGVLDRDLRGSDVETERLAELPPELAWKSTLAARRLSE